MGTVLLILFGVAVGVVITIVWVNAAMREAMKRMW